MILVSYCGSTHDDSISAYINGEIKYAKYERESGIKHGDCPLSWYSKKIKEWGIDVDDVTAFASSKPPFVDGGFKNFEISPYLTQENNKSNFPICGRKSKNFYINHHFCHAYSNFNFKFGQSKALVVDGRGDIGYRSWLYNNKFNDINMFRYKTGGYALEAIGRRIGITEENTYRVDIPGKIMGLQSYGSPNKNIIEYFQCTTPHDLQSLIDYIDNFKIDFDLHNQDFLDFISTAFWATFDSHKKYFQYYNTGEKIIYSGGVAQNVNWNRELLNLGYVLDLQPHLSDECLSLGGLRTLCDIFEQEFNFDNYPYGQDDESPLSEPTKNTIDKVAQLLAQGKIVGWYQGHGEIGPRALGNRSILMNPTVKDGKDILNHKVKHREWWRPFGASVKQDKASEYFDLDNSPYMLYTAKVLNSNLHSITHVDDTCRHQTVTPEQNPLFYDLLDTFESKTGLPVLLNTSLNLGGKPIAGKIEEAIKLFKTSEMDALCVGNDLYIK